MSTTYIRARDGVAVDAAEALDGTGRMRDGYGVGRRLTMMDAASRQTTDMTTIMDAATIVFDAAPGHFGGLSRVLAQAGSDDAFMAANAASEARTMADRMTLFADGFGPFALTDAQKAQFRRVGEYLTGIADATEHRAAQLRQAH